MSVVVDTVVDVFEAAVTVTLTVTLIGPTLALVSDDFKDWYLDELGEIMALFGINDEDVVETQVLDQRLMDDETVNNLLTKVALDHQDTQRSIIDLLSTYTARTRGSMNSYFDYGKNTYVYGLPTTNIKASSVPELATIDQIKMETGESVVHLDTEAVRVPTKEEYVYHQLDKLYGYRPYTNHLTYLTKQYSLKYIDYNYGTNEYDCTIFRAGVERTETTVTVTPVDATNDNKHTYVKMSVILLEETIVVSETNTDELVPKGTVTDSYSYVDSSVEYDTTVISLIAFNPVIHIVVKWYITDNSQWRSWVYELGSGITALDNSQRYLSNIDMLPIVELRNNRINVTDNTTTTLYAQSKAILEIIGIDIHTITDSLKENPDIDNVEDAYIYFGVDLKDTSPTIAKMMYNSIEFFYYDKELQSNAGAYKITIQEGKFNQTVMWRGQTRTIVTGTLGPVNTYQMTTSGNTLIVRKQETQTQYVEYQMIDIGATTFIQRGSFHGVTQKTLLSDTVRFPVSFFQMNQLSPLEQLEIFGKALRLQTYSISITHLEWYETSAFANLIKVVLVVVAVVLAVLSAPIGGSLGEWAWYIGKGLLMYGASVAFQKLLESTNSQWLRAFLIIVVAVALYETGQMDINQSGFFTVDKFTWMVTDYTEMKMEELSTAANAFMTDAERVMEEISKKTEEFAGYLDTAFVTGLATKEEVSPWLTGPSAEYYKAIGMNFDTYELAIHNVYENIFDYDKHFRLGVV